jgi:FixJ family two-component response regulator
VPAVLQLLKESRPKAGMMIIDYRLPPVSGMELMRDIMTPDADVKIGNALITGAKIRLVARCR